MTVLRLYLVAVVIVGFLNLIGIKTGGSEVFSVTNILLAIIGREVLEYLNNIDKNISKSTERQDTENTEDTEI